ncbi:MAG TPA: response regulator [Bacteriovoracaceae bacterium]|nr:response regulator [Bacteriovoracaceae bacterium]
MDFNQSTTSIQTDLVSNHIRVLLIEDSEDDAFMILRTLQKSFQVTHERVESSETMKFALANGPWDILISDVNMPRFTGTDAFNILKSSGLTVPFILVSGALEDIAGVEAMRLGVDDFLLKGNLSRLVPAVTRELQRSEVNRERKKAEVALRLSQEQLRQSQKMEAIGRLAGGVAHDFNNLLAIISLSLEIIRNDLPAEHPLQEYVSNITHAQMRGTALTHQLLSFSRKQAVVHRIFDLNELILGLIKMLDPVIGEDIELVIELESTPLLVNGDFGQVEQLLMNLVVNARDALVRNGIIKIQTLSFEDKVKLTVADTGIGMSEDIKSKIFEPFFTTKEVGKGTGLGLAAVHGVLTQMGGEVMVESKLNEGTSFHLYFPKQKSKAPPTPQLSAVKIKPKQNLKILLVEDEAALRNVIEATLKNNGYKVALATNGVEALELIEKSEFKFDIIVTDVVMPKMGGSELFEKVRVLFPETKVLLMSGYTEEKLLNYGVLGMEDFFLEKPFSAQELLKKISAILER